MGSDNHKRLDQSLTNILLQLWQINEHRRKGVTTTNAKVEKTPVEVQRYSNCADIRRKNVHRTWPERNRSTHANRWTQTDRQRKRDRGWHDRDEVPEALRWVSYSEWLMLTNCDVFRAIARRRKQEKHVRTYGLITLLRRLSSREQDVLKKRRPCRIRGLAPS